MFTSDLLKVGTFDGEIIEVMIKEMTGSGLMYDEK